MTHHTLRRLAPVPILAGLLLLGGCGPKEEGGGAAVTPASQAPVIDAETRGTPAPGTPAAGTTQPAPAKPAGSSAVPSGVQKVTLNVKGMH